MAYDEYLADRVRNSLNTRSLLFDEKKMFGGLCFLVDDKMCIGIVKEELMIRVDPETEDEILSKPGTRLMDFTGRVMKGFYFVGAEGLDSDGELDYWVEKCLEFNPEAGRSKKSKK